mmetsp:Transcript_31511/g.72155  ORF Transcript_31511/g.72155 Transcript_31511/m.72155 type:complete len:218 (-) Transcript_31511:1457-2110(-)
MARGSARQVSEVSGTTGILPHQALLHLQHAHHPADGAGLQSLLCFTDVVQPGPHQPSGAPPGKMAGRRGRRRTVHPRGRHRLLHLSPALSGRDHLRPLPRRLLPGLYPHRLRPLLQDLDRGLGRLRPRRGQAAEGLPDGHEGTSGLGSRARAQPVHSHRGGLWRHVHRGAHRGGGFLRGHRIRDRDSVGGHHYLPVLRVFHQGTGGRSRSVRLLNDD